MALSLRLRLIVSIAGVLALTLIVGCVLVYLDAVKKVDTEMRAALSVGIRTVQNATDDAEEATNPQRQLELLVEDFDGNRHVQAFLMNPQGLAIAKSMLLIPSDPSPLWFDHLIARDPEVVRLILPAPFGALWLHPAHHGFAQRDRRGLERSASDTVHVGAFLQPRSTAGLFHARPPSGAIAEDDRSVPAYRPGRL